MADTAGLPMADEGIDDGANRCLGIVGMQPVEIDRIDTQVIQALPEIAGNILGRHAIAPITLPHIEKATLGRDHDALAITTLSQPGADGPLAGPVGASGIQSP